MPTTQMRQIHQRSETNENSLNHPTAFPEMLARFFEAVGLPGEPTICFRDFRCGASFLGLWDFGASGVGPRTFPKCDDPGSPSRA